jgi:hypothetical protein
MAVAVAFAGAQDHRDLRQQRAGAQPQIDEAGASGFGGSDIRQQRQTRGDGLGQNARRLAGRFGRHHRGVGRHVAMGGVTRRRHLHARGDLREDGGVEVRQQVGKRLHGMVAHAGEKVLGHGRYQPGTLGSVNRRYSS